MKKGLEDKVDKVSLSSRVQSFEEVNRELTKVNDALNALLEKTTQTSEVDTTEGTEGNPGDIKTILNSDKTYSFSIRTEDGWKTPFLENREIIFKSKNPSAGKIKKSIDEIESNSTDEAKKTIFDEKNDKFILPRPDYNSGWVDVSNTQTTGTHTLGVVPILQQVWWSSDNGATISRLYSSNSNSYVLQLTSTTWGITGSTYYGSWNNTGTSLAHVDYTGWKVKVLLWK